MEGKVIQWKDEPNEDICYYRDVSFAWITKNNNGTFRRCKKCGQKLIIHGYAEGAIGGGLMCYGDYLVILEGGEKKVLPKEYIRE